MSTLENQKETVSSQMLTVDDVATILKVSSRSIWRLRSSMQIPKPVKIGGGIRWRQSDIEKWIAEGCPAKDSRNN